MHDVLPPDPTSSKTPMTAIEGFGGFIRPTPMERAAGRLMRAPDHGADGGEGGDQGGDNGQAADAAQGGADGGQDGGQSSGGDAQGGDGDEASLLGGAGAEAGSGDSGKDGEEGDEGKGSGKDAQAASDVPETYELKPFTVGEGDDAIQIEIDAALLESVTPTLKEAGVTQDQLTKIAPTVVPQIQQRLVEQQADDHSALKAQWAKEVQSDKEIGGKNWTETEALAAKALDHFGAPSEKDADGNETNPFRVLLNETGLGNHPEMVRMFRKIGAALGEDSTVRGDGAAPQKVDRLEVLYPDDVPEAKSKQGAK